MKFHKVLKSNLPSNVVDDNIFFTEEGGIYINDNEGKLIKAGGGESKVLEWAPNSSYTKNSLISCDNRVYLVLNDFTTGETFSYDTVNLFLVSTRITGSAIQFWQPNTNYKLDDLLYYNNMLYRVNKGFQSGVQFDPGLDSISLVVTDHNALYGIQGEDIDYFHLSSQKHQLVNNLEDLGGKLSYKGSITGDMNTIIYDRNNDGIVDQAESLLGLNVSVSELNSLQGVATNLQDQINALSTGMVMKGELETRAELDSITELFEGLSYVIKSDETQGGSRTYYVYNTGQWFYMGQFEVKVRNFFTDPIDLVKEVMNTLPEQNIDVSIARKTELHSHDNMNILKTYTNSNSDITSAVEKSHYHNNLFVLNKLSEDGTGNLIFDGKPISSEGGSGIVDLSNFTTDDLVDYPNKRYVTDLEKSNIGRIPSIMTTLTNVDSLANSISGKIPSSVSGSNAIATEADIKTAIEGVRFRDLNDVGEIKVNEMLSVDLSGQIISMSAPENGISSIIDKSGESHSNVKKIKFANCNTSIEEDDILVINQEDIFSTEIKDMPGQSEFINDGFLVADLNSKKYKQKDISEFTQKLENKRFDIDSSDWQIEDSKNICIINHGLQSENVIAVGYISKIYTPINYEILDSNNIKIIIDSPADMSVIINTSQGTISANTRNGGGSIGVITPDMFLDDLRERTDRAYSSSKVMDVLKQYTKSANVYTRTQSDARYSIKENEHAHLNVGVLNNLLDLNGDLFYNNKKLITSFNPTTHTVRNNNNVFSDLALIIDTSEQMIKSGIKMINNAQFLIKNTLVTSSDPVLDEECVELRIEENNIAIVNVKIKPGESQQYTIGISPDVKILARGNFDCSYVITGF